MSAKTFLMTFVLLGVCALVTGCGSDSVAPTTGNNEAPFLPPQNVTVTKTGNTVIVSWDESSHSNLLGYKVYRLDIDMQAVSTLTTQPVTMAMYLDTTARQGHEYEYRVTSVSVTGQESAYTARMFEVPTTDGDKRNRQD